MIKVAILEDNRVHLDRLKSLLFPALEQPCTVSDFSEESEFIKSLKEGAEYDVAFLDIELGKKSGIEAAREALSLRPELQVIYTTQYLNYVSPVYETRHTYFIHKPELEKYLKPALDKALAALEKIRGRALEISWNREIFRIMEKDIMYMERTLRTTSVYTRDGSIFRTSEKLTELLPRLGPSFTICQRSFIVNLEYISSFHTSHILLSNGKDIPVSRSHTKDLQKCLDRFLCAPAE